MFWVVQKNLYHEIGFIGLMDTLERFEIPHATVEITETKNIEPDINPEGLVMVCGAIAMSKIAARKGWHPGSFLNENFHFDKWREHYGDHLLNNDAIVSQLKDVKFWWPKFFLRPCEDTKSFTGRLFTWEDFESWRTKFQGKDDFHVSMSSPKDIFREYRFFVVDGELITWSQYKLGNTVTWHLSDVDDDIKEFAKNMVKLWEPARAFVIDIALTREGCKIVELNNINSAGFYAADIPKLVMALDSMEY